VKLPFWLGRRRSALALLGTVVVLLLAGSTPVLASSCAAAGDVAGCCKVCSKGKACGDTCISRDFTCHVGAGCACDG
jgi:hypothetical protein